MQSKHTDFIRESIIRDMSEGVMAIGMDGIINYVNPAVTQILERDLDELSGQKFVNCFFEYEGNDTFNQTILDAIYDTTTSHRNVVPYFTGKQIKQLHVTTSYQHNEGEKVGIVVVISDISELTELRDAVQAMERIKRLNNQLEIRNKLLSETFGRFLSDEIVHQLLDTPEGLALGGKKSTLTIMMSDLRGFTALSEQMEARDLIAMLNHYLGEMTEIIQKRNGTIIEFIGDGILAIFGAPLPSECHASEAVASAVEMQARMDDINEWNEKRGYPLLEMGIGLNTGEVIVGNIGSEKRTKYGVVGSHVNLAGRIESYTVGGQILVSPLTRKLVLEPLEIAQELNVFPKGVKKALTLTHVIGIGGKYGLSCRQKESEMITLETARKVEFFIIKDKHIDLKVNIGHLTAISKTEALMETDTELAQYDNLQLEAGGKLFCKVMSKVNSQWLLRFTVIPQGFEQWFTA